MQFLQRDHTESRVTRRSGKAVQRTLLLLAAIALALGWLAQSQYGTKSQYVTKRLAAQIHPVFQTPVSNHSASRPAIQVDVLDASDKWLWTAKLYLTVQSSRFPAGTWVVLPINVGDFQGCRTRFVQLPFEVSEGDTLLFNLLKDNQLSAAQEKIILNSCRVSGYCVIAASCIYCPQHTRLVAPVTNVATDILGVAVIKNCSVNKFTNLGLAEFHSPAVLPATAGEANCLTLLDGSRYSRVDLKLFGPTSELALR